MTKPVMRDTEAAEYLGICRASIWNLVARNAFPSIRIGRCSRFRRADIDAYLDRQTVTAEEAAARRPTGQRGRVAQRAACAKAG